MADFIEKIHRMTIRVKSPDGSAIGTLTGADGRVRVELDEQRLRRHTETSLGAELNALMRSMEHAHEKAVGMVMEEASGTGPSIEDLEPEVRHRREKYAEAVGELSVVETSPGGNVKARVTRAGLELLLRPGTLRGAGAEAVAEEIDAVVAAAREEYGRRLWDLSAGIEAREGGHE